MYFNNWNDIKQLSRRDLEELVPQGFGFKTSPWKHQLATFLACIANPGFFEMLDLGTGKTKVTIDTCRWLKTKKPDLKVLVFCLNAAVEKWGREVAMHSGMNYTCLRNPGDTKWDQLQGDGFFIVNFESTWRWLASIHTWKDLKGRTKSGLKPDKTKIKRLLDFGIDVFVIDESHILKSPTSLTYKLCRTLRLNIPYLYLLSGTPFHHLLDIWSQYWMVDKGETFCTDFYRFRNMYFVDKGHFGPDFRPTLKGKRIIEDNLFHYGIRYSETEVDDLPPKVYDVVYYNLDPEQNKLYQARANDKLEEFGEDANIPNKTIVFRQICGGFVKATKHIFKRNPKLDALMEVVNIAVTSSKIVIFHQYTMEGKEIEKRLKKAKISYCTLNGRTRNKDREQVRFQEDDKYKVMVAHPKSGGASIDLFAGAYCAFYSNGGSVIDRKQCEKRIHRGGQAAPHVFYYDFVGLNTCEPQMLLNLLNGVDSFDGIIDKDTFEKVIHGGTIEN